MQSKRGRNRTTSVPNERIIFLRFVAIKFKFVYGNGSYGFSMLYFSRFPLGIQLGLVEPR